MVARVAAHAPAQPRKANYTVIFLALALPFATCGTSPAGLMYLKENRKKDGVVTTKSGSERGQGAGFLSESLSERIGP